MPRLQAAISRNKLFSIQTDVTTAVVDLVIIIDVTVKDASMAMIPTAEIGICGKSASLHVLKVQLN